MVNAVSSNGKIIYVRSPVNFVRKREEQSSPLQELVKSLERKGPKRRNDFFFIQRILEDFDKA